MSKKAFALPVSIVAVGFAWLLNASDVLRTVDWVWTALLAVFGVQAFLVGGWNKLTFVVGPLFLAASGLSIFRQLGRLELEREIPSLVILLGLLWMSAEFLRLPTPRWLAEEQT
jgi:hypothetical protein